eukprot:TRINITY_DN12720_c0_g1_i10.p2 TRINITY_DN12720_c0_g1~~TRINITY_DN12720_c0_g1_i10.p2  ORF type:complete len:161 (+),score=23.93 TRINITY_DN12720_c0_g1_i10:99-581(+)
MAASDLDQCERIDRCLLTLMDHFNSLIQAAYMQTDSQFDTEDKKPISELLEITAEKMVLVAQEIVNRVAELKKNSVINNFTQLNKNVKEVGFLLDRTTMQFDRELGNMKMEAQELLQEIQLHCSSSILKQDVNIKQSNKQIQDEQQLKEIYSLALQASTR